MIKIKNTLKIFFIISSAINIYGMENQKKNEFEQSQISYKTINGGVPWLVFYNGQ